MAGKEQIAAKILETGGGLKVRGALNPVLWLYALTSSSMLSGAIFVPQYALLFITALLIVLAVALSSFIYLLFRNPDRLQSEEYQIRKRSMEIMQEKGDDKPRIIDSVDVTGNPEMSNLEDGSKGKKDA